MLDILALTGLEWLYDRIEDRYGSVAAWLVTIALGVSILAACVWAFVTLIRR